MSRNLSEIIRSLCYELVRTDASFVIAQRTAFFDLLKDQYHDMFLNDHHFLGLENLNFSFYLKPVKLPWWKRIFTRKKEKEKKLFFEMASENTPGGVKCEVTFSRTDKTFVDEIKIDGKVVKNDQVYVN